MNNFVAGLITFGVIFTIVATLNDLTQVGEAQNVDRNESFLAYNNTAYGVSINYPHNWQVVETSDEEVLSNLEYIFGSDSQGNKPAQKDDVKAGVLDVLETFGLDEVSDILGLSPDKKAEILQKISQEINKGTLQLIVEIFSPPDDENDISLEGMNIFADNISAISPISLNEYVDANIEGLKSLQDTKVSTFKLVEPKKSIVVDGNPAISIVYTASLKGSEESKLFVVQTIRGDMSYILTFGASPETYLKSLPTFKKMLDSFSVSN